MMLSSALVGVVNSQTVMLALFVVAMNTISVAVLIHGINMIYRVLGGRGSYLIEPEQVRNDREAESRWNVRRDRQERWSQRRKDRKAAEAQDRKERAFVRAYVDAEMDRRRRSSE